MEVSRQARQLSNPFGISGHDACVSEADFAGEKRIGQCYNEIECLASGGQISGYCSYSFGSNILVDYLFIFIYKFSDCFGTITIVYPQMVHFVDSYCLIVSTK